MVLGLALQAGSWAVALKLVLIWLLVLAASAAASHLVARAALRAGIAPMTEVLPAGDASCLPGPPGPP